jgi:hypothetical protein
MPQQVCLFLSTVSDEFKSYREALRHDLERPNVSVKIQEDFIITGSVTMAMLDDYIQQCDAVIHLVGDMTGAMANPPSIAFIRERYPDFGQRLPPITDLLLDEPAMSYTQWEAWLALYHRKTLIVAAPTADAERHTKYILNEEQRRRQQQHLARLKAVGYYPFTFASCDRLTVEVLRSSLQEILVIAGINIKPLALPQASIGAQFMGRDSLLEDLYQSLGPIPEKTGTPITAHVLSGLGGIGKTRLALEYAWRNENYTARLFVGADSATALQSNLAHLTHRNVLNLPEQSDTDEQKQRDAVIDWLNQYPGWLMILDNVDSENAANAVEDLIPRLNGGHILVTSRLSNYSNAVTVLPVKVLGENDAVEFLLARTSGKRRKQDDDAGQARVIAIELGYLPLALEQAGAYISQRRLDFKAYLDKFHQQAGSVLGWYDPRLMQYPKSVAITWQTSFDQLSDQARCLLQRLAWLSPAPIPESLLDVPIPDVDAEGNPWADLAELEGYSLASRASDSPSFTVHKLVQEVTRQQAGNPEFFRLQEMLAWLNAAFVGDPNDVRDWPVLDPLAPHALALARYADGKEIVEPTCRLLNQLGSLYLIKALYQEAEPLMRRVMTIHETSHGKEHLNITAALNNLAKLLKDTNRLAEAEPLVRRALAIDEARFGDKHPYVAHDLNNLALLLQDTNRLTEAEPLMRRALAIDEASLGDGHPKVAIRLNNLALLLKDTNRLTEAEPLMRRALSITETRYGNEHPNVALALNNLAQLLQASNRLAEAEPLMQRVVTIYETSYGKDHPNVAVALNNLAQLLQDTNRLAEAEPLMRRALSISETSYGKEHPDVAAALNNLAQLLKSTNRLAEAEAEPLMQRVVTIYETSYGKEHPNVAVALNNLAQLLKDTNRLAEAEPLMRRALSIAETSYGKEHPDVAAAFNNLAQLLQATNRLAEAEPLMRRALAIDEASFGDGHPNLARDLNNLATLLQATHRLIEAEPLMRRALVIFFRSYGDEHPSFETVAQNYFAIGGALGWTKEQIVETFQNELSKE